LKNQGLGEIYPCLLERYRRAETDRLIVASDSSRASQQAHRQEKNRAQQGKNSVHRDANDPEWQTDQPYKWIGDQRQQRKGPAKNKQDAPQ
jgi:hypothetical protein